MNGVKFNNIHSFDDLGLILSVAVVPPAIPKTNFIEVPGMDGHIDASEWTGFLRYNSRELKFTFSVKRKYDFERKKQEVFSLINGKVCEVVLDKDSDYYYKGRCWVSEINSSSAIKQIVVTVDTKPYKVENSTYTVQKTLTGGNDTVVVVNGDMPCVATIHATNNDVKVKFGTTTKYINAGDTVLTDFILSPGNNTFTITGSGSVTITMQRGWL